MIISLLLLCFSLVMTVWVTTTPSPSVLCKEMGTLVPGVRGTSKSEGYKIHHILVVDCTTICKRLTLCVLSSGSAEGVS